MGERADETVVGIDVPNPTVTEEEPRSIYLMSSSTSEEINNYYNQCRPLYNAAMKGDWEAANRIIQADPTVVRARITEGGETALHIATTGKHIRFVKKLVAEMNPSDLGITNGKGNTALCFAALDGTIAVAEVMIAAAAGLSLPDICGHDGVKPLYMAALCGNRDMVNYLYRQTNVRDWDETEQVKLLNTCITSSLLDTALKLVGAYPNLTVVKDSNRETALHVIARNPSVFASRNQDGIFRRFIKLLKLEDDYSNLTMAEDGNGEIELQELGETEAHELARNSSIFATRNQDRILRRHIKYLGENLMQTEALKLLNCLLENLFLPPPHNLNISEIIEDAPQLLFTAAYSENTEFMIRFLQYFPNLVWKSDYKRQTIFHVAVKNRNERIFNLLHEIGSAGKVIATQRDDNNNNLLHLVASSAPPSNIPGAALKMQYEIMWFKEVEKIVQPLYREMGNSEKKKPHDLFIEEHVDLLCQGEKWMKKTTSSCMVVATLISTVMFAAAFTVPGGNDNKTGQPIFLPNTSFMVFVISDALSLFSSTSSLLIFLSILTSNYAEEDFLYSLPKRLILGLVTLFMSIATMMTSFCATLFVVLDGELAWFTIPMAAIACIPVTLFALLQFPLFVDIVSHTYRYSMIFRRSNHLLY